MSKLYWGVYRESFNGGREIEEYNIFDHGGFMQDVKELARKRLNKEQFCERLRRSLLYYYWSKCEWEVVISQWPPSERYKSRKVDVYSQVMLNWDVFCEYVWKHRKELKEVGEE